MRKLKTWRALIHQGLWTCRRFQRDMKTGLQRSIPSFIYHYLSLVLEMHNIYIVAQRVVLFKSQQKRGLLHQTVFHHDPIRFSGMGLNCGSMKKADRPAAPMAAMNTESAVIGTRYKRSGSFPAALMPLCPVTN